MKSQLFKSAWKLVKGLNISMSEALKTAWAAVKNNISVSVSKSYTGKVSAIFSKSTYGVSFTSGTFAGLCEMINNHKSLNNDGAAAYYGIGVYNGD